LNVELIGPHLVLLYVTYALADVLSTSVGAPEDGLQVPRETPGALASLVGGYGASSQNMFAV
jgi:hypothetical protein